MLKNIFKYNLKLSSKSLKFTNTQIFDFGVYRGNRELSKEYEREKSEYKKATKEMRKQHTQEFWVQQTKVENEWIESFLKIQKEKKFSDDAKLRNTVIKNSFQCYENIKQEIKNQQEFLAKQKLWREEDTQILMEKHSILSLLDRQAEEDWLTPDNIDYKLSQQINQILPPTILSHVDYYKKLNDYALLMEQGLTKEAEDVKLNKQVINYKNKQLQPLYEELKTIIRHFTYTEENSVHALYQETLMRIDNYLVTNNNKEDFKLLKDNLNFLFKKLVSLLRTENEKPDNKLEIIEHQLKHLTMILVLWNKYTEIIYTPDADIEKILAQKNQQEQENQYDSNILARDLDQLVDEKDPRILKEYYFNKVTEKKTKGSGMFIQDFRGLFDDVHIRNTVERKSQDSQELKKLSDLPNLKESYTTESDEDLEVADEASENAEEKSSEKKGKKLLAGAKSATKKSHDKKIKERKSITGEKRKLLESEVSEVFEEEEEIEVESSNSNKEYSDIIDTFEPSSNSQKSALKKVKKDRKLLEEFMLMQIKNEAANSKVSNLNVAKEYKTYKENLVKELGLKDEKELFADIDKELEEVDLSSIIDVNEYDTEIKKEQERMTIEKELKDFKKEDLFKSDLFNSILKYSKDIFDFKKPNLTTNLDIYDENLIRFLEYSIKESNLAHKSASTSIIMEFIKDELKKIEDEKLNPSNKLKKKHLIRLADICGRLRIQDSQNLKNVLDMFKHPTVKFE